MKHIITLGCLTFMFVLCPALAYAQVETADDNTANFRLEFNLDQLYRYTNQLCPFSYQVPEPPSTKVLWAEDTLPTSLFTNPGHDEVGEYAIFHRQSIDQRENFKIESWCIYKGRPTTEPINAADMADELQKTANDLNLKEVDLSGRNLGNGGIAVHMEGLETNAATQNVMRHVVNYHYQRGQIMIIKMSYNAETARFESLKDRIMGSIIHEVAPQITSD